MIYKIIIPFTTTFENLGKHFLQIQDRHKIYLKKKTEEFESGLCMKKI